MSFWIEPRVNRPHPVWFETEEIKLCVGEFSCDKGKWQFHHNHVSAALKIDSLEKLINWSKEQVLVLTITDRLKG